MRDIVSRIDALTSLIHDLLLYARPRPLQLRETELMPLLEDALSAIRKDPAASSVRTSLAGIPLTLPADAELLKAMFLNLIINATQAMDGDGNLAVTVTQTDGGGKVTLADTGPGIPPEIRDRVFEPFFTTRTRGTGLGLSIAKRTVELHGGTLSFDCPSSGGTVVTVTLPRRACG